MSLLVDFIGYGCLFDLCLVLVVVVFQLVLELSCLGFVDCWWVNSVVVSVLLCFFKFLYFELLGLWLIMICCLVCACRCLLVMVALLRLCFWVFGGFGLV